MHERFARHVNDGDTALGADAKTKHESERDGDGDGDGDGVDVYSCPVLQSIRSQNSYRGPSASLAHLLDPDTSEFTHTCAATESPDRHVRPSPSPSPLSPWDQLSSPSPTQLC